MSLSSQESVVGIYNMTPGKCLREYVRVCWSPTDGAGHVDGVFQSRWRGLFPSQREQEVDPPTTRLVVIAGQSHGHTHNMSAAQRDPHFITQT